MTESLRSPSWFRVAILTPQIPSHVHFHRHLYRGEVWYVVQDPSSGRSHRLSRAAFRVAGLMDGSRSMDEIWAAVQEQLGDDAPTQDETIRLLSLLHRADLMRCDVAPDTAELLERGLRRDQADTWRKLTSPLAIRVPLIDPDAFLTRWVEVVRPLFTRGALVAIALLVVAATIAATLHWSELAAAGARELLEPRSLIAAWLVYPVLKAVHEFAHAFAVKVWGGEVHEMGVLFLVLLPIPYVDASSATAFSEKWKRVVVGAAGIAVELSLASMAVLLWLVVEPGWIRSIAWVVMWIGGASTLIFNGNPLLRFDGYYVLADWIETPNLAARSTGYIGYLVQRYVLILKNVRNPVVTPSERPWLVAYGVLSFVYRLVIWFGIAVFLAQWIPVLGIVLALFTAVQQLLLPLLRHLRFLLTAPWIAGQRLRAVGIAFSGFAGLIALASLAPITSSSTAQGVVWPPERSLVRTSEEAFVVRLLAQPGQGVETGDPLILTRRLDLDARTRVLEARLAELRAEEHAQRGTERVRAQITREEMTTVRAELSRARERSERAVLRSPSAGTFVLPEGDGILGRYLREGELVGYVLGDGVDTVRVVITQEDAARVMGDTRSVELRFPGRSGVSIEGSLGRQTPASTHRLPHPALGAMGGGDFAIDPEDPSGLRTLDPLFEIEVALPEGTQVAEVGRRAFVRFEHTSEPLLVQTLRSLRGLFLRRIGG